MGEQRMIEADDRTNELEMRVLRALEAKPEVSVPADFAARVAARVPARMETAATPARYGTIAMRAAMAVLVVALVVVGVRSADRSTVGIAVEGLLCAQLVALAIWRSGVWRQGASEV